MPEAACTECDTETEDTCAVCGWPCCVDCNADTDDIVCPPCKAEELGLDTNDATR